MFELKNLVTFSYLYLTPAQSFESALYLSMNFMCVTYSSINPFMEIVLQIKLYIQLLPFSLKLLQAITEYISTSV